jgi:hypothetical protein
MRQFERPLLLYVLLLLFPGRASFFAAMTVAPEQILRDLGQVEFDFKHSLKVEGLSLHRGAVSLTFERGNIVFFKPVADVVTGFYFFGQGTILSFPLNRVEKQQLHTFTGSPVLNEHFVQAYVRFTDDTHAELLQQLSAEKASSEEDLKWLEEKFGSLLKTSPFTNFRIAADLLGGRKLPLFYAQIMGLKLGLFDFCLDSRKTEDLFLGQYHQVDGQNYYDTWCRYSSRLGRFKAQSNEDLADIEQGNLIDVQEYDVSTNIDRKDNLEGVTHIEYVAKLDGEWVLCFDLSRFLKLSRVEDEKKQSLSFYQNDEFSQEKEVSRLGHDLVQILLKQPLHLGEKRALTFYYQGDVISRIGSGVFYVGSRGSWYPNTGFYDRARYRLKFRCPQPFTVVATGDLVKETTEGEARISEWRSDLELPMAGFNYGEYVKKQTMAGPVSVEVYANKGVENVYLEVMRRREQLLQQARLRISSLQKFQDPMPEIALPVPDFTDFDTTVFAESIARQVANTILLFEPLLGKFPYNKLAVSQIPGRTGQGWPTLLYVSSLSFLSPQQRSRLGLGGDQEYHFWECLHAHEVAHQWLGNQTVGRSYHDLWIFEGFANYLGYYSLQSLYPEGSRFRDVLKRSKARLFEKTSQGDRVESAGPVWLGTRLNSSRFPSGYFTLVYEKGAWIMHMLRYLFGETSVGSDQLLQEIIREFLQTFRGKLAGTEDLKKIFEKRLPKSLDLEGNGRLDWFFDEGVYNTGIPEFRIQYTFTPLSRGGGLLKGKILQSKVPEEFMMPVEVFAQYGQEKAVKEKIGRVVTMGPETQFRFQLKRKPVRVTLDDNQWILCDNKTQ